MGHWFPSSSLLSSSLIRGEFVQLVPLHPPHILVQSSPCFLHVHRLVSQSPVQPHLTDLRRALGAGSLCVVIGTSLLLLRVHPHCVGSKELERPGK